MRHAREELGLCLVRAARRICRAHQVLFAAFFFAVKAHRKEHLLRFAIFPARLHDEARKMPVAVPHGVFEHHGILVPQSLRESRKVKKRFNIGQILRHDALLARCAHMDACFTAVSGQPVHLPLACNLFIITRAQVDAVNRIIDLADGRDDLVAHPALRERRFQRVLVLALLPHDLIHAAEVQQDLKARFRLLHPIGAYLEIDVPDGVRHTLVAAADAVLGPELAHQIFCVQKLQEVRCALLKDALVVVMLDRLGIGK